MIVSIPVVSSVKMYKHYLIHIRSIAICSSFREKYNSQYFILVCFSIYLTCILILAPNRIRRVFYCTSVSQPIKFSVIIHLSYGQFSKNVGIMIIFVCFKGLFQYFTVSITKCCLIIVRMSILQLMCLNCPLSICRLLT